MNSQLSIDDLKSFIRRRKILCLVTFSVVFSCAIGLAVFLPPAYRSQATIRITEQQISEEYIKSVMDLTPEQRLQSLTGAVMSYTKLQEVIKEHNLYPELQKIGAMSDAVIRIKENIDIEPVVSSVTNPRSGRSVPVTSALILGFQGRTPEQVKNVTQALSNLYVEEDTRKRGEMVDATTGFLEGELDRLKKNMQEQETKISEFKRKHLGELPENSTSNSQIAAGLERDLNQIDNRLRFLEDRKISLNGQLATVTPLAQVQTDKGMIIRNPHDRMRVMQIELVQLQTRLSDKHPDVIRAKREIAELKQELGIKAGGDDFNKIIKEKQAVLNQLEEKYGGKHPNVIRLKKEISSLAGKSDSKGRIGEGYGHQKPDNPAYINIMTQIDLASAEMKSLIANKAQVSTELQRLRNQMNNAPIVETQINEMLRSYENSKKTYNNLMEKLMGARVSQAIEEKDRGTKFTIADPAYLPNKPFKPDRLAIVVLGFVVSLGASFAMAAFKEATDQSIKSEKELSKLTDLPVLSTLPLVGKERKK